MFRSSTVEENSIRVEFDYAENGLATRDGKPPSHFELAGKDRKFFPATASIEKTAVVVRSTRVAKPIAVRYAFTSQATPNLTDNSGLPASSFRSDSW